MNKYFSVLFLSALVTVGIFSGCEKKEQSANLSVALNPNAEQVPAVTSPSPVAAVPGEGVIRGKVLFNGTVPEASKLDLGADPVCSAAHSEPLLSEEIAVNPDKTIRNAFVYIKEGLPSNVSYPQPTEAVTLDQKGCHYSPHVFGVRVNQPVQIVNSDPTLHNVHGQFQNNPEFNLGMPLQGMKSIKKFSSEEVMAHVKCDVHPWMSAYVGVVNHPYFAVTGEDGSFEFKGLPSGHYVVQVWQEKYGTQNIPVDVTKGVSEIVVNYNG